LAPFERIIGCQKASITPKHGLISTNIVEIYATRRCFMGTNSDSTTISSHPTLRTLFLKREGILGYYHNLHILCYLGLIQLMFMKIIFE